MRNWFGMLTKSEITGRRNVAGWSPVATEVANHFQITVQEIRFRQI